MPKKVPDTLAVRKAIDAGRFPPVWLWAGPEEFLKDELFRRLAAALETEGMGGMNLDRFRGGEDAIGTVITACRTLPMLGSRRVVLVKETEKIPRRDREALLEYVRGPSPETVLVLAGKSAPGESWHRSLTAAGAEPAVFWVPFENQTLQWIQIRFKDLGLRCTAAVAGALLERCGGGHGEKVGLGEIAPEIEKVALAVAGEEVRLEDLEVVARKADEALRIEVVNRVTRKDAAGALRALDGALLFRQNHEVRLVAALTHRLINIAAARDLRDAGERGRPSSIWPGEWEQVGPAVGRFDGEQLARSLQALAEADRTLKSRPKNPRTVLEQTILSICQ